MSLNDILWVTGMIEEHIADGSFHRHSYFIAITFFSLQSLAMHPSLINASVFLDKFYGLSIGFEQVHFVSR